MSLAKALQQLLRHIVCIWQHSPKLCSGTQSCCNALVSLPNLYRPSPAYKSLLLIGAERRVRVTESHSLLHKRSHAVDVICSAPRLILYPSCKWSLLHCCSFGGKQKFHFLSCLSKQDTHDPSPTPNTPCSHVVPVFPAGQIHCPVFGLHGASPQLHLCWQFTPKLPGWQAGQKKPKDTVSIRKHFENIRRHHHQQF